MLKVIGSTAALGILLPLVGMPIIDNWGHAGGTIAGALIGLGNGPLTRFARRRGAALTGFASCLLIVASAGAQLSDDRDEARKRQSIAETSIARAATLDRISVRVEEIRQTYRAVISPRIIQRGMISATLPPRPGPTAEPKEGTKTASANTVHLVDPEDLFFQTVLTAVFKSLTSMQRDLDGGSTSPDYRRLVLLTRRSLIEPPTIEEFREFEVRITSLMQTIKRERDFAQMQALTVGLLPRVD